MNSCCEKIIDELIKWVTEKDLFTGEKHLAIEIFTQLLRNNVSIKDYRIVAVQFSEDSFLTFLVDDVEKPCCPGYPAMSLKYYKDIKNLVKDVKKVWTIFDYEPKYKEVSLFLSKDYSKKLKEKRPI